MSGKGLRSSIAQKETVQMAQVNVKYYPKESSFIVRNAEEMQQILTSNKLKSANDKGWQLIIKIAGNLSSVEQLIFSALII